jgi:hypothetical protein
MALPHPANVPSASSSSSDQTTPAADPSGVQGARHSFSWVGSASYPGEVPGIDHRAIDESPLIKELAEIGKGEKPLPKTEAKRHHFIPQLTLNRFTG